MLEHKIIQFLNNPFPIWENSLTTDLVYAELSQLSKAGLDADNYSTQGGYFKNISKLKKAPIFVSEKFPTESVFVEYPDFSTFNFFYEEHGLEPEGHSEINNNSVDKLKKALDIFNLIPYANRCISSLIKRIQILKQVNDEIDTSYSHPEIPFSIFVSLCSDSSTISNLRVAESILHEAMHLKLTLIEKHINLIKPETTETFYSPWRDEQRPLRGVLHGIFVFTAVLEMYKFFYSNVDMFKNLSHISYRIEDIEKEISLIRDFKNSDGLTAKGKMLCSNLLI